jgi:hypothetical protein
MLDSGTIIVDEFKPKAIVENTKPVEARASIVATESINNIDCDEDYTGYLAD